MAAAAFESDVKPVRRHQTRRRVRHGRIRLREARQFDEAWRFAAHLGLTPTVMVSINWIHAPHPTELHPADRNALLRDGLKAWLRRHAPAVPFVWIEAREAPRAKGEGVHLFVFVPAKLRERFAVAVARLVARQSLDVGSTAVDVRPVGPRWFDRRDYVLKGGDGDVQRAYRTRRFGKAAQGVVEGPRLRVAHSIGRTARSRAGWSAPK